MLWRIYAPEVFKVVGPPLLELVFVDVYLDASSLSSVVGFGYYSYALIIGFFAVEFTSAVEGKSSIFS
jgi:hypothetical protein